MKNVLKKGRYFLEYLFMLTVCKVVQILPYSFLKIVAYCVGAVLMVIAYPLTKVAMANIRIAFPEKDNNEVRRIARLSFTNIILSIFEFFWFLNRPDRLDKANLHMDDLFETINEHRKNDTGAVYVTPHIGNWELASVLTTHITGATLAVVVKKTYNPYLHKLINAGRSAKGNTRVIPARGAVKGMIKAIKDKCIVATLIDQNTKARAGGVEVTFFGLPVYSSPAPALFARKLNVPVVISGCVRKDGGYYSFTKQLPREAASYQSHEELIQDIMHITEEFITLYPEQYLWFYRRFQHIPRNASEDIVKKYPYYATVATERFYDKKAPKVNV